MLLFRSALLGGVATICLATGAVADLTAETVWNDWRGYLERFGQTVSATEDRDGDRLVLTGVRIADNETDAPLGAAILMDRIVLTEVADGGVRISLPAVMPVTLEATDPSGRPTRISMDYRQTGLDILATGQEGAIDYAYRAETVSLEITGVQRAGQTLTLEDLALDMALDGLEGTATSRREGDTILYGQEFVTSVLSYRIIATDTETGTRSEVTGQMRDLGFHGESTLPADTVPGRSMTDLLSSGLRSEGRFAYAASALELLTTSAAGTSEMSLTSQAGAFDVALGAAAVSYAVRQTGLQAEVSSAASGFPVQFTVADSAFDLSLPFPEAGSLGDFRFGLALDGLALSEALWRLLDPGGQVPRDPAMVVVDLLGKGSFPIDTPDLGRLASGSAAVDSLDVRQLRIAAGGAEISGNGGFTFETGPMGPGRPEGAIDLTLKGGNGLIDRLIAGGMLGEGEATGIRMMMAMLARPGEAPDSLVSRIEVTRDGQVRANGQRIR